MENTVVDRHHQQQTVPCTDVTRTTTNNNKLTEPMYVATPLIESRCLSAVAGCNVYMKLENVQPSGSFKLRGISNIIQKKLQQGCSRLVASSGGNAGMAAAYVARHLGTPLTLYVPQSTSEQIKAKLVAEGADVVVHGSVWDEADAKANEVATNPEVGYIPPFDHPDVWEGHATMVSEISEQLKAMSLSAPPDLIILSVGGGGLLIGVVRGMQQLGWTNVPVLAMETNGADCFNAAVKADKIVTLPAITSVAKCLGALTVASEAFRLYKVHPIISEVVSDKVCVDATCKFLDDHRFLVEPACGASVAAIYGGVIQRLQKEGKLAAKLDHGIVLIVCGGMCVNLELLQQWKQTFGID